MPYGAIALQVNFGVEINPHLFRNIVPTDIAIHTPEQASDVALVLAHSTQATSERYHNQAGRLEAT